jgi:hypothetical protein
MAKRIPPRLDWELKLTEHIEERRSTVDSMR